MNLTVNLDGFAMNNPLTVASGTFGSGREFSDLWAQAGMLELFRDEASLAREALLVADGVDEGQSAAKAQLAYESSSAHELSTPLSILGAITTKGVSCLPWSGNEGIRIAETASGILNSIGLQNPGVEAFCEKDLPWLGEQGVPIIVNVAGHSPEDYLRVIERLEQELTVAAYEVNISCPNVACGGMSFGTDVKAATEVTRVCREATKRPLILKLTPNVTDITEIARCCEAEGADILSLINTVAGMAIDISHRKPLFERKVAGLSGPAIKPIALYAVYRCYQAVGIPLIGMGGIVSVEDIVEFMLAGASAVAIGSHGFTDPLAAPYLLRDLTAWCEERGIDDINELIGGAQ